MTLSLKRRLLSKPSRDSRVHLYDLGTVRARNKNKAHSFLLDAFKESDLSKTEVAKMLGKKPEQITRWLGGPGNLTLDTLSDLIFVLKGQTFTLQAEDEFARGKSNRRQPEWLRIIDVPEHKTSSSEFRSGQTRSGTSQYVISTSSREEGSYEQFRTGSEKGISKVI